MEFTINQIAGLLDGKVEGDGSQAVSRLDKIHEGEEGGISFLSNMKYQTFVYSTQSTAVIVCDDFKPTYRLKTSLVRVADAYVGFTQLIQAYADFIKVTKSG